MVSFILAMMFTAPPAQPKPADMAVIAERTTVAPPQPYPISIGSLYSLFEIVPSDCSASYARLIRHIFPVRSHLMDMMRSTEHEYQKDGVNF